MILDELRTRIAARRADGQSLALLVVDLGVIGRIDAAWGYAIGDGVRARFAAMLRAEVLRPGDYLDDARREELAYILDTVQSEGVALLAADKILRALDTPVWVGEDEIYARPAIGIALFPGHGEDEVGLLRHARTACQATRGGPERVAVYAEAQERQSAEALLFDNRLRSAVTQEGLEQVFDPIVEFRTGLIAGAEGLLRWRDGAGLTVPVEKALEAAESAGRAEEFASWLLNGALRSCGELRQGGGLDLRIGVNLSARSLREAEFPDLVSRALRTWGLRPSRLSFEIAGTALFDSSAEARDTLKRLKALGVRLSIDDLGAGIGSLAALATLPFDELKLDLAAMPELPRVPQHLELARSLIELAHRLRLEVVACGVGGGESAACLKELGCDYVQGAHVSAPLDTIGLIRKFGSDNR